MNAFEIENWELAARECVRDTIARYTHSGDRFMMEEYAGVFMEDGVLEIRNVGEVVGRQAIFDYFTKRPVTASSKEPTIMRHNITNVLFDEVTPELIKVSSYFTVFSRIGLDHMGRYRDQMVPDGDTWRIARRFVSVDWSSPDSVLVSSDES